MSDAANMLAQTRANLQASEAIAATADAWRVAVEARNDAERALTLALHAGKRAGMSLRQLGTMADISHAQVAVLLARHGDTLTGDAKMAQTSPKPGGPKKTPASDGGG